MRRCVGLMILVGLFVAASSWGELVTSVEVRGADGAALNRESVQSFISLQAGDDLTLSATSRDVKALQKSGRFSHVEVLNERVTSGIKVVYVVTEKPRIRRLRISGADAYSNQKVRDWLDMGSGDLVDDGVMAVHARKVIDEYSKKLYPFADVTWEIQPVEGRNQADVFVFVKEGPKSTVGSIEFEGNDKLTDDELHKVMMQKVRRWYSWISGSGKYNSDAAAFDQSLITKAYRDRGYLDVQVSAPLVEPDGKHVKLIYRIVEGELYKVGSITISGEKQFDVEELRKAVPMQKGSVASMEEIQQGGRNLQDFYGMRGYISTGVSTELDANAQSLSVRIHYVIKEGNPANIRNVRIQGNTRTRDKVIRREITVFPGDQYDSGKIRSSEMRLRNLGFFSQVNSTYTQTADPDYYDLSFDVAEQRTGQFMVGAGFSSIDNLIGFVELGQGNFDLFNWPPVGGGQKLKLRATVGSERMDLELSYAQPYFLDRKLRLDVDLFRNNSRYYSDDYDQLNIGGSVGVTKPVSRFDKLSLTYSLQNIEIFDVSESASDEIKQEAGTTLQSSMTLAVDHDTRNSYFTPTRGNKTKVAGTLSGGIFGGEVDTYRLDVRSSNYWTIWGGHVIDYRSWASVVEPYGDSEDVRIFDRLFLGGPRTMRGFEYREVGPKDESGEPLGGQTSAFGTLEYQVPLRKSIWLVGFYDVGMVWADAYDFDTDVYNADWGVSLRLNMPGFPLQLNYAWQLESDEFNEDDGGLFSFMLGYIY